MKNFGKQALLRFAALAAAGTALSGCVYDVGLGYASDGYYDDYGCDPYGGYDSYYDCDYRSGFYNIGFGGGWYDSFWYPGHGYYLFDNYGRRYQMRDHHRRYWGEKRHHWYRDNRGRHRDGGHHRGRGRGYSDNSTPGAIGWPEQHGGRVRDGDDRRGRGEGRRGRNDQWRGGGGQGADAVPVPNPDIVEGRGRGRGNGEGYDGGTVTMAKAARTGAAMSKRMRFPCRQPISASCVPADAANGCEAAGTAVYSLDRFRVLNRRLRCNQRHPRLALHDRQEPNGLPVNRVAIGAEAKASRNNRIFQSR